MIEALFIGFLLGIRHAMESDHVAAVASLVTKSPTMQESILLGSVWGLGHTVTLFAFGLAVLMLDKMIPEHLALALEFIVGFMLVVLGIDVIRRFMQERVHLHPHRHEDGVLHIHAHSHHNTGEAKHQHQHHKTFPMRALLVGIMHGMAGSAALIILTLQTVHSVATGLIYIALFGIGSIAGMALLSVVIMLPLRHSAKYFSNLHLYLQLLIGSATTLLGMSIMFEIANT